MTTVALINKTFNGAGSLSVISSSVHYYYGGEHGGVRADVELEMRVLHLVSGVTGH